MTLDPEPLPRPPDDPLARALNALRGQPLPEGPTPEVQARTQAALREAAEGPGANPSSWRRRAMPLFLKAAASALLAAAGLFYAAGMPPVGPPMAFAEVAQKLRDARTLSYRQTTTMPDGQPPIHVRVLLKSPGLLRVEPEGGPGAITIMDAATNRTLVLDPATRTAAFFEGPLPEGKEAAAFKDMASKEVAGLRKLAEAEGQPVGRKRISGVEAEGFQVDQLGQRLTIWLDAEAKILVRIDIQSKVGTVVVEGSLSDFKIDPPLDDVLFRVEPPAGYKLEVGVRPLENLDDAWAEVFGTYARHNAGAFPDRLDDPTTYGKNLPKDQYKGSTNPRLIRLVQAIAQTQVFLQTHKEKGAYGYRPAGLKLGDSGKILFWYRTEGAPAPTYRAIFGDLHAAEVPADRLPEPPRS